MRRLCIGIALASSLLASGCSGCGDGGGKSSSDEDAGSGSSLAEVGVRVLDDKARSCEFILLDSGGRLERVEFGDAVRGEAVREGDRMGVALLHEDDAPFTGAAAQVPWCARSAAGDAQRLGLMQHTAARAATRQRSAAFGFRCTVAVPSGAIDRC